MGKKYNISFVKKYLFDNNIILLSEEYKNNKQQLECKCKICGNIWYANFNNIKDKNSNCFICSKESFKKTCMDKYGVDNPFKSEYIKEKIHQTCITRYGCRHAMQNKEISLKQAKSQRNSIILHHWKTNEELVCTASYEKAVVEYLNKNKIDFDWQIIFDIPNERKYFVDLYLKEQDKYVEIKGYMREHSMAKWNWFHSEYPNSELWNKDKLKEMRIL